MTTNWMAPFLQYESLGWDDVAEGTELPSEERMVDATLVVAGALASGDFYPVHHDLQAAKDAGSPDIFLNILTTTGLMSAYITNWSGPAWELEKVDLRLKIPAFPGQNLTFTGNVAARSEEGGNRAMTVEFTAATDFGPHCQGSATLRLAG